MYNFEDNFVYFYLKTEKRKRKRGKHDDDDNEDDDGDDDDEADFIESQTFRAYSFGSQMIILGK